MPWASPELQSSCRGDRAYAIISRRPSSYVYKKMKFEELLPLYDSFHTFAPEYCVERLIEIAQEKEGPAMSD